jgi:beta-galactosidase/beta-glucuronidase
MFAKVGGSIYHGVGVGVRLSSIDEGSGLIILEDRILVRGRCRHRGTPGTRICTRRSLEGQWIKYMKTPKAHRGRVYVVGLFTMTIFGH